MIPSYRLIALLAVVAILPIFAMVGAVPVAGVYLVDAGLILVAALEGIFLWSARWTAHGTGPVLMFVGTTAPFTVSIENRGRWFHSVRVVLQFPEGFAPREARFERTLPPRHSTTLRVDVHPADRGDFTFPPITVRFSTKLGLISRQIRVAWGEKVYMVYPRQLLSKDETRFIRGLAGNQVGVLLRRFQGKGSEFEALRLYTKDDDFRSIDWKSSARLSRHVIRTFRPEANQRVVVLLDLGRQMRPVQKGKSNLDWAIETCQILARVAEGEGDYVGVLAFHSEVEVFIKPRRGKAQLKNIGGKIYRLKARSEESNYPLASAYFKTMERRRSFVPLITQIQDPESATILKSALSKIAGWHVPLVVNIAELDLIDAVQKFPETETQAYRRTAAIELKSQLDRLENEMHSIGVPMVTVSPEAMLVETVNRYLDVKRRGLL